VDRHDVRAVFYSRSGAKPSGRRFDKLDPKAHRTKAAKTAFTGGSLI
jgi:hypothetical protein